jgi:hypothetical protein
VDVDRNSQSLAGGEICEMSVEEWGNPFDVRGMTDVPDYMEMTQWCLAGRCKGKKVDGVREDMGYAGPSCDT